MKYNPKKMVNRLIKICGIEKKSAKDLDPETKLIDLGVNSLKLISFLVKIEEEFSISIHDADLLFENFETIHKMHSTLAKYFDNKRPIKKCLIVDCDNVLWKGISGEESICVDEDVKILHNLLLKLYNKGIILCLCSKNEPHIIAQAFEHQNMQLKKEMFLKEKINFLDKVTNILEITNELNFTIDSIVFVDDSPYEIGYVKSLLPKVHTITANYSDMKFINEIGRAFANTPVSNIDRTRFYREQKNREEAKLKFMSIDQYNDSLETQVHCGKASIDQAIRLSELSQRTRQFNLSDCHYSIDDINELFQRHECIIISLSAKDKYGDLGIVGMSVIQNNIIEAFIISCRVFGRNFEMILINKIKEICGHDLAGCYVNNDNNSRFSDFFSKNNIKTI